MAQKSIAEQLKIFDPKIKSILLRNQNINMEINEKQILWRGLILEDRPNLRMLNNESAWFAQTELGARFYAKELPYTAFNAGYILKAHIIKKSYIASIQLRNITEECSPDGSVPLWQKNVLLPLLIKNWRSGEIVGFLDEPTTEILLAASTYEITSCRPTANYVQQ